LAAVFGLIGAANSLPVYATPTSSELDFIRNPDPAKIHEIRTQVRSWLKSMQSQIDATVASTPRPSQERMQLILRYSDFLHVWLDGELNLAKKQQKIDEQFDADVWKPINETVGYFLKRHSQVTGVFPVPTEHIATATQSSGPEPETAEYEVATLVSEERERYSVSLNLIRLAVLADSLRQTPNVHLTEAFQTVGGRVAPLKINGEPEIKGIAGVEEIEALKNPLADLNIIRPPLNPATGPKPAPIADEDKAAIEALVKRFFIDLSHEDLTHVRDMFFEPAQADELITRRPQSKISDVTFNHMECNVRRISDHEIAVSASPIQCIITEQGKPPSPQKVGFEAILTKTNKGWQIARMGGPPSQ
jgi:hypothetical protein